jgi:two-component system nitrate/nitrite response regulator NarL
MIRVLIVADIRFYREGLAGALASRDDLDVVGVADDLEMMRPRIVDLRPDVVLIDQAMPESLAAVRAIHALVPDVKVVALAVPDIDQQVIACAEAGVAGYVPRGAGIAELVFTIQSVSRDELPCSPRVAATLLRRVNALAAGVGPVGSEFHLTARELQILRMLDQGAANKDIARALGIEVATAKNHVHNILEKLGVKRRGEAAARLRGQRSALRWPQTLMSSEVPLV